MVARETRQLMPEVVVGVVLTALLGGLLVPWLKPRLDRRSEWYKSSVELVDSLASSLWAYWKLALRVAYYGRQEPPSGEDFELALRRRDSDEAWQIGCDIQIQVADRNDYFRQARSRSWTGLDKPWSTTWTRRSVVFAHEERSLNGTSSIVRC
jgi:hypothetical protein